MADIMTAVGTVFTQAIGWVGTVATTVTSNDVLLLFCVAIPICGIGVGMFKRLLSTRG